MRIALTFYLIGVWIGVTLAACIVEFLVVWVDRRRTIRAELILTADAPRIQRLARINDLAVLAFFLPSIIINVNHALQ